MNSKGFIQGIVLGFVMMGFIVLIFGLIGCGVVEVAPYDDGGADSSGRGGTTGTGGTGGGTSCTPDDCNACIGSKKTPLQDGTPCGDTSCGPPTAPSPFGGTYSPQVLSPICRSGACVTIATTCDSQSCNCTGHPLAYTGCFTDTVPATCKCVNTNGAYCE